MSTDAPQSPTTASRIVRDEDCVIIAAAPYADDIRCSWFDPTTWGENAEPVSSGGRGTAWFVRHGDERWVLRHYSRGGLVARLNQRHYLFTGEKRVRSFAEFNLLLEMQRMGLPVPQPVASCYRRVMGCGYQASVILEELAGVCAFADYLHSPEHRTWREVGRTVRRFHDWGIDHADLNCHNILIAHEGPYLIDFDKGRRRRPCAEPCKWKNRNLSRLKRSIEKLASGEELQKGWDRLIEGYNAERSSIS